MPSGRRVTTTVELALCPGVANVMLRSFDPPGSTSAPSGVRAPSHTTARPAESRMWYERSTGFAPAKFHGMLPLFVSFTASVFVSAQYADIGLIAPKAAA